MIIFRADVSPWTGLRHLRRCAYLAALLKKNNDVLVCSREDKRAAKFLAERNLPTQFVKDPAILDLGGVKALIFDLDVFSPADITLLDKARQAGIKVVQILGSGDAGQAVDIQVSGAGSALLHHKFRHFNKAKRKYRKNIKNIFINLGDHIPYRDLRLVVDTLHRLHLKLKIAPGLNLKKADKRNLMKIYPGSHFCGKSESPARAYFEADLALIPAGEEILEAAAVGTPALYFYQEPASETLAQICLDNKIGLKFGKLESLTIDSFRDVIAPLTPENRQKMGETGKKLVDGLGVQRFFKVLKEKGIIKESSQ
jgi:spore coat polysaccharide biosynthesis predicted glycosyltransferase SpsG